MYTSWYPYAHFVALRHPFSAAIVAQAFLNNVFKLHGLQGTIVSDRDAIFLSSFWQEFFKLQGVELHLSTAYHPQTDGQTEVVNRSLETYLRCMITEKSTQWSKWLSLAEWWYNTPFHSSIQMSPFEALYGYDPPIHVPYIAGTSKVAEIDRLIDRDAMVKLLRFHIHRAQHRMTQLANKKRSDRCFDIGDWVYVKLQSYKQQSVAERQSHKLSPLYFGPYPIIDKVGQVAYKLKLPSDSLIHPTLHVSKLKRSVKQGISVSTALPREMSEEVVPVRILDRKMVKRRNHAATKVLVQWSEGGPEGATWEFLYDIKQKFPSHTLVDQGIRKWEDLVA